jgi:hypothetical protein
MQYIFDRIRIINFINRQCLDELLQLLTDSNYKICLFDGAKVEDASSFFEQAPIQLPWESGMPQKTRSWDALTDNLFGGICELDAKQVAILWNNADVILKRGLPDLLVAISCFEHIGNLLLNPTSKGTDHVSLKVFLIGDGENFKNLKELATT